MKNLINLEKQQEIAQAINNIRDGHQVELSVSEIRVRLLFSDKRAQVFPDEAHKLEKFFFAVAVMRRTMQP